MRIANYVGNFDLQLLRQELLMAFPEWHEQYGNTIIEHFGLDYLGANLTIYYPDTNTQQELDAVILAHDSTAAKPIDWSQILQARQRFLDLPNYSTWTAEEAEAFVNNEIFAGWTEAQVNEWIEANVTNIASAKTALEALAKEVLDLRLIVGKMAYLTMLLRDIAVKRSLL